MIEDSDDEAQENEGMGMEGVEEGDDEDADGEDDEFARMLGETLGAHEHEANASAGGNGGNEDEDADADAYTNDAEDEEYTEGYAHDTLPLPTGNTGSQEPYRAKSFAETLGEFAGPLGSEKGCARLMLVGRYTRG
jgi:hypothetical protein